MLTEAEQLDRLVGEADAALDRVREVDLLRGLVVDSDVDDLGVEDVPDPVAHGVVNRLQLELPGQRVLDAVDQGELGVPLPRLVHEPRVLERNAEAAGERLQELLIGVGERVLAIDVLERDHARRLAAGHKRDEQGRPHSLADHHFAAVPLDFSLHVLDDQHRFARVQDVPREPSRRARFLFQPLTPFDDVSGIEEACRFVERVDRDDLRVEDIPDPVAHGVIDRLQLELPGQGVLDAVDQGELGVALPRLVHQPRVLERHAEAPRKGFQELLIRLAEGLLAVVIHERDDAGPTGACHERDEQNGLRDLVAEHRAAVLLGFLGKVLVDHQRRARLEDLGSESAALGHRLMRLPFATLDQVREVHEPGRLVHDRDEQALRVEDLPDPVADGVVDRLLVELPGDRLLDAVDQRQLGVPLARLVHEPRVLECNAQISRQRRQ